MNKDYHLGDLVRFRKKHPCGGDTWEIMRIGMDFKVKCTSCQRVVMLAKNKFIKKVKEKVN